MNQKLKEKISESFSSVLPITIIVLVLGTVLVPLPINTIVMFLVGAAFLVVGVGFFSLGAEMAMMPMGESVGSQVTRMKKLWMIVLMCFTVGLVITVAEPDLQVLAGQVTAIPNNVLILTVGVGVGLFLVIAVLRVLFKVSLSHILLICYALVFVLSIFVPNDFIAVAFDSGGVTTGPITVPFILALGAGLTAARSDREAKDDSFGMVAICSIGPILAIMILGILYNPQEATYDPVIVPDVQTTRDVVQQFAQQLPVYIHEVLMALLPICIFFVILQVFGKRFHKRQLARVLVGIIYTLVGLVLFLTGVNVGFIPVGSLLGSELATWSNPWILVPIGMVIGYFLVSAEPAVHILNHQVEEVSNGAIPAKVMGTALSLGAAASVALTMVRVITGISIYWFIVPGYAIALGISFFVPKIFTGIAFDSGGVASGPMSATFLLPFVMGACESLGGNILTDAFGAIAMIAMTPLIAIQVLGLIYKSKMAEQPAAEPDIDEQDEIIHYEEVPDNG